ncbi:MAG: hypothetical protein IKU84_04170 [Clostridia bacterium]|nr:hypothetical protein [Clostridia bacterium]
MVKGVSKRIVHIKTGKSQLFSEAIFILKEEIQGVSEDELIKEAVSIAEENRGRVRRISKKAASNLCFGAMGALLVSVFWILSTI